MKRIEKLAIGAIIAAALAAILVPAWGLWMLLFGGLQRSHIDANTPAPADFNRLLQRDLQNYAQTRSSEATLQSVELLRQGATQSGTAYPKFYAWAVFASEKGPESGAVRLAAIRREEFQVTDFVSCADARDDPSSLRMVFPAPVAEAIDSRVQRNGCP